MTSRTASGAKLLDGLECKHHCKSGVSLPRGRMPRQHERRPINPQGSFIDVFPRPRPGGGLLGSGDALSAFQMNPLVTLSLVGFGLWLVLRLCFAKDLEILPSNRTRLTMLLSALLINWAYIWHQAGSQVN